MSEYIKRVCRDCKRTIYLTKNEFKNKRGKEYELTTSGDILCKNCIRIMTESLIERIEYEVTKNNN